MKSPVSVLHTCGPHIQTLIRTFMVQIKLSIPRTGPNGTFAILRLARAADVVGSRCALPVRRGFRRGTWQPRGTHGGHVA